MTSSSTGHPPGPRGLFGGQSLLLLRREPWTFQKLARRYGDIVYFRIGVRDIFLVSRPSLIRKILLDHYASFEKDWGPRKGSLVFGDALLTSEGAEHKAQRQELARVFGRASVGLQRPMIAEMVDEWSRGLRPGQTIELFSEMSRLSTTVAVQSLFGCRLEHEEVLDFTSDVSSRFGRLMMPHASKFRLRRPKRPEHFSRLVSQIRSHVQSHDSGDCLLRSMIRDSPNGTDHMIATFLITGQETVRVAITMAWWLLSANREPARRLEQESRERSADDDSTPPYAKAVFSEALRLYPPAWMIGKRAIEPYDLDGYEVPPGALVLVSPYIVHRDERHFPDPEAFKPERWLESDQRPADDSAYFPFSGGPRRCIGEAFAIDFGTTVLSRVARDWRFECDRSEPRFEVRLVMRPRKVRAEVRSVTGAESE